MVKILKNKIILLIIAVVILCVVCAVCFDFGPASFFKKAEQNLISRQDIYHGEARDMKNKASFAASEELRQKIAYVDHHIEDDIEKSQVF